jgi:hypothetical protein
VATIIEVKAHDADGSSTQPASYDISLKVANAVYMVRYTDAFGTGAVRYAGGHELLVHVGRTPSPTTDFGPVARGSDHQPEAGHKDEAVEVNWQRLWLNYECPHLSSEFEIWSEHDTHSYSLLLETE